MISITLECIQYSGGEKGFGTESSLFKKRSNLCGNFVKKSTMTRSSHCELGKDVLFEILNLINFKYLRTVTFITLAEEEG